MTSKSSDMSDLDDDLDPSVPEGLGVPRQVAMLVNSPTTDTLDSVTLEASPTDEDQTGTDRAVLLTGHTADMATDHQGPITFQVPESEATEEVTLDGPDEEAEQARGNEAAQTEVGQVFDSPSQLLSMGGGGEPGPPTLSSYFGSPEADTSASDIFDSIAGQTETSGLQALTESQFDSLTGGGDGQFGSETGCGDGPMNSLSGGGGEDQFYSLTGRGEGPETADSLQVTKLEDTLMGEITVNSPRYETQLSDGQPESIPFEGETTSTLTSSDLQGSSADLLSKAGFESFTAQGEEPVTDLGPSGDGLERKRPDSQEQSAKVSQISEQSSLFPGHQQHHQTPSVGTTPTQLSPLSTPVHQAAHSGPPSQLSPQAYVYSQPPGFDRQTSVPSAPSSPFHKFESTSPTPAAFSSTSTTPSAFPTFADTADDPFTSSLSSSDTDRRYDAWLPSDATRHILITMATSPPGSYIPPAEQLSCPQVLTNEPQGDPVRDLVYRYIGEVEAVKRKVLGAGDVAQDVTGIEQLIACGCLRAAVDLTGKLLADAGQGETTGGEPSQQSQYTLQLWFCRLSLLVRLRLYDVAGTELRGFQSLDTPDLYYEFYPHLYPGRRGSMVPFGMRLLHAELPSFLGRSQEALDKLYYVKAVIDKMVANLDNGLAEDGGGTEITAESRSKSLELWRQREVETLYKIAGVMVFIKDYEAALSVYESLLVKDPRSADALRSGIGRIHLQMGSVPDALEIFRRVEADSEKGDNSASCRNAINRGMVALCQNNFSEAYTHFKSAVQLEPQNTCAVNNMAVCSLYLGRLKDALNTLESLVHKDPANNLHEGILFNLCTLYELESSRALHKKQAMLDLVSRHKGDGFPIVCLKMT